MFNQQQINIIKNNSKDIQLKSEAFRDALTKPTKDDLKNIRDIVIDYCKNNKRKVYGGYAMHMLIKNKNMNDGIYEDDTIGDIDFYSPEPLNDLHNICDSLVENNYNGVLGDEALHLETYAVKVGRFVVCNITYMPKFVYNTVPFVNVQNLWCVDISFMIIDYYRVMNNPLNYWRIFDDEDELKVINRINKILGYYPLGLYKPLQKEIVNKNFDSTKKKIYDYCTGNKNIVIVGGFVLDFYKSIVGKTCYPSNDFVELISDDYINDAKTVINIVEESSYKEYQPYFQFLDHSIEIYMGENIICKIYKNILTPFTKINTQNGIIQIGTFNTVMMYNSINMIKLRSTLLKAQNKYNKFEAYTYQYLNLRDEYFKRFNKNILDDTIFKEFEMTNFMGEIVLSETLRQRIIEERKKNKQVLKYYYDPTLKKQPPTYYFKNTSGSLMINSSYINPSDYISEKKEFYPNYEI